MTSKTKMQNLADKNRGDILACGLIFLAAIDKLTLEEFLQKVRESIAPIEEQTLIRPTARQIKIAIKKSQYREETNLRLGRNAGFN